MSLQTRTFGATNFTFFHQDTGLNTTSELLLDNTGARITGSITSPTLYPIRFSELKMQFQESAGNVTFKLSTGNNNSDSWTSGSISTTTSTSITRTATPNVSAFTNQTWFYGWRKLDSQTTRGRRGNVDNKRWANGSLRTGPIWAEVTWQTAPNAPSSVSVSSVTSTSATLTWTKPTDLGGLSALTGYRILYKESSSSTWSSTGKFGSDTTTSRTITGLDPSTEYDFLVAATNAVTDAINSSYTSAGAHTGTNGTQRTATTLTGIRVWNGSSFIVGATKVWSGSAFVTGRIRVWNGSAWVDAK